VNENWHTCKAGFRHAPGSACTHIVAIPGTLGHNTRRAPLEHDVVVMNASNEVIRTYKFGGIYSDEEIVKRREENKIKYEPLWEKEQREREHKAAEKAKAAELFA